MTSHATTNIGTLAAIPLLLALLALAAFVYVASVTTARPVPHESPARPAPPAVAAPSVAEHARLTRAIAEADAEDPRARGAGDGEGAHPGVCEPLPGTRRPAVFVAVPRTAHGSCPSGGASPPLPSVLHGESPLSTLDVTHFGGSWWAPSGFQTFAAYRAVIGAPQRYYRYHDLHYGLELVHVARQLATSRRTKQPSADLMLTPVMDLLLLLTIGFLSISGGWCAAARRPHRRARVPQAHVAQPVAGSPPPLALLDAASGPAPRDWTQPSQILSAPAEPRHGFGPGAPIVCPSRVAEKTFAVILTNGRVVPNSAGPRGSMPSARRRAPSGLRCLPGGAHGSPGVMPGPRRSRVPSPRRISSAADAVVLLVTADSFEAFRRARVDSSASALTSDGSRWSGARSRSAADLFLARCPRRRYERHAKSGVSPRDVAEPVIASHWPPRGGSESPSPDSPWGSSAAVAMTLGMPRSVFTCPSTAQRSVVSAVPSPSARAPPGASSAWLGKPRRRRRWSGDRGAGRSRDRLGELRADDDHNGTSSRCCAM